MKLRNIPYAETRAEAERLRRVFTRWCGNHSYDAAREAIERDWKRMVTLPSNQAHLGQASSLSERHASLLRPWDVLWN